MPVSGCGCWGERDCAFYLLKCLVYLSFMSMLFLKFVAIASIGICLSSCSPKPRVRNVETDADQPRPELNQENKTPVQKTKRVTAVVDHKLPLSEEELRSAAKQKAEREALTSWLEEDFDDIVGNVGSYYCLEPQSDPRDKNRTYSVRFRAIVMERNLREFTYRIVEGRRSSKDRYSIQLKVFSPKRYYGKQIHLYAWEVHPGPKPSWMNELETGNLVQLSVDIALTPVAADWSKPLELRLSSVKISSHRSLCKRPADETNHAPDIH